MDDEGARPRVLEGTARGSNYIRLGRNDKVFVRLKNKLPMYSQSPCTFTCL